MLEDGRSFPRRPLRRAVGETFGEAVFTTGMTGYQETLTDPLPPPGRRADRAAHRQHRRQRRGRRVRRIWVAGYVVRDAARVASQLALPAQPATTSCARRASSASAGSTPGR